MQKNYRHSKRKPPRKSKSPGVMNIILVIVGISLLVFTISMVQIFRECGAVPDTLVTCVFAALGGECGIMGWIKTSKDKYKEREWEIEDREDAKREAAEAAEAAEDDEY